MMRKLYKFQQTPQWLIILAIVLISTFVYVQVGFNGRLQRDDAIYLYSGQQIASGLPPYISIFDHKGPIAPLLAGLGVTIAQTFQTDDILTVRVLFLGVSVTAVIGIYLLGHQLFASKKIGLLSAFVFLNYWGYGNHAASGPRAKTPMVLFEILSLWLTARKKWFWAGLTGALAFLTWQPAIIYPFTSLFLALVQANKISDRLIQFAKTFIGFSLPIAIITIYFAINDALFDLWGGFILFNLRYLDRSNNSYLVNIKGFLAAIYEGYPTASLSILLGFFMIVLLFFLRLRQYNNQITNWLRNDRAAALILTLPIPFAWSIMDFQGYADFFVFLPYTAIGFGWFLSHMVQAIRQLDIPPFTSRNAIFSVISLALILNATFYYINTNTNDLQTQKEWAEQAAQIYGSDGKIMAINVPQALVILQAANPDPYVFVKNGIDDWIETAVTDGFTGWVSDLDVYQPSLIFYSPAPGKHMHELESWLETNYQKETTGDWIIFVRQTE